MKGKSFLGEWKSIFTNKALLIPIIGVMLIPILYAGMFLWAFWDPYDKLEDLPVAIVNEDQGASFEGEQLEIGDELVKNLKKAKDFNFIFVDKEEGYKNLKNQDYYMLIEIPKDFSKNATTILDENPKKLELKYVPNEGYNFLSAQMGEAAIEKIKAGVSENLIKTYSDTIFVVMEKMSDGYQDASKNAGELNDGATKVSDGNKAMKESLATLAASQVEFKSGVDDIYKGVGELSNGSSTLENGMGQLKTAHGQLQSGASEVKTGIDEAVSGSTKVSSGIDLLNSGAGELQTGLGQLQEQAPELVAGAKKLEEGAKGLNEEIKKLEDELGPYLDALPPDVKSELSITMSKIAGINQQVIEGSQKLAQGAGTLPTSANELYKGSASLSAGLGQLDAGATSLNQGLGQLQAGQGEVVAGMQQFGSKLNEASNGAAKLNNGLHALSGGASQLADGSNQLADGTSKISEGANELAEGAGKVQEGTEQFKTELGSAAEDSSKLHTTEKTSDMMSQPLAVDKEVVDHVPNYGTGFAPYFLSLGLFVGALMLSILYPMVEPAVIPKNAFSWFASKFGVLAIIGILQALIAAAILLLGLKIEVQSVPLFLLFSIITSLVFITLIQFFVTCFGNPGRFMAIIILILQLTTSAGTFPLELIPTPLQFFNAFLPMTYTVSGFKAVITSGEFSYMWSNAAILGGFIVLFMLGTLSYFGLKFKKSYSKFSTEETA